MPPCALKAYRIGDVAVFVPVRFPNVVVEHERILISRIERMIRATTDAYVEAVAWLPDGQLHRDDGPAMIGICGTETWYQHGKRHRCDGPAETTGDSSQAWYRNGVLHRVNGPALIGTDMQGWYRDGQLHRLDGPAVEFPASVVFSARCLVYGRAAVVMKFGVR